MKHTLQQESKILLKLNQNYVAEEACRPIDGRILLKIKRAPEL